MAENESPWFLCNTRTRFESGSIGFEKAIQTCSEIAEADAADWNAWRNGWSGWKSLTDVPELFAFVKKAPVVPPPMPMVPPPMPAGPPPMPMAKMVQEPVAPKTRPAAVITPALVTTKPAPAPMPPGAQPPRPSPILMPIPSVTASPVVELQNHEEQHVGANRRKFDRYDVRMRVIIRNEQLTFRTFSMNISLGGICLEHALPPHLFDQRCHIFIAGPSQKENLRMSLAQTSRNDLHYFSFAGLDQSSFDKLKRWLEICMKKPAGRKVGT